MRNFLYLTKIQVLNSLGLNKILHSKKKFGGILGVALLSALFVGIFVAVGYVYANIFAQLLVKGNSLFKLVPLMTAISSLIVFFFGFYATGAVLFNQKGYDVLIALPIKKGTIVASKLAYMTVSNLVLCLLISVPSLFVYANYDKTATVDLYLRYVLTIIVSPFFAQALAVTVGTIISYVSSRFRKSNFIQTILLFVVFGALFAVGFLSGEQDALPLHLIEKIYFIFPVLVMASQSFVGFIWYALINLGSFALITLLIALFYTKINSLIASKKTVRNFKLKSYKGKSVIRALLKREFNKLFSLPIYAVNALSGAIMSIVISVGVTVAIRVSFATEPLAISHMGQIIAVFVPALFSFSFMLSPTTNCALSIEGSAFWMIRTLPLSFNKVINVKLLVNVIINTTSAVISSIIICIGGMIALIPSILIVLTAVSISMLGANLGLLFNALFPKLKWENPNEVVKQSAPVLLTMLVSFILSALLGVFGYFYGLYNPIIMLTVTTVILLSLAVVTYLVVLEYAEKLLMKKI